jgi:hypothetical protein
LRLRERHAARHREAGDGQVKHIEALFRQDRKAELPRGIERRLIRGYQQQFALARGIAVGIALDRGRVAADEIAEPVDPRLRQRAALRTVRVVASTPVPSVRSIDSSVPPSARSTGWATPGNCLADGADLRQRREAMATDRSIHIRLRIRVSRSFGFHYG